jgi:hypothetical protein
MMKCGGRGNVENGMALTAPGELAIVCPACPIPGVNLPEDWAEVSPELK